MVEFAHHFDELCRVTGVLAHAGIHVCVGLLRVADGRVAVCGRGGDGFAEGVEEVGSAEGVC